MTTETSAAPMSALDGPARQRITIWRIFMAVWRFVFIDMFGAGFFEREFKLSQEDHCSFILEDHKTIRCGLIFTPWLSIQFAVAAAIFIFVVLVCLPMYPFRLMAAFSANQSPPDFFP